MGKVTLRCGHEVLHFTSPSDAARYKAEFAMLLPSPKQWPTKELGEDLAASIQSLGSGFANEAELIILDSQLAAKRILEGIVHNQPKLSMHAVTSFWTALRANSVRSSLQSDLVTSRCEDCPSSRFFRTSGMLRMLRGT